MKGLFPKQPVGLPPLLGKATVFPGERGGEGAWGRCSLRGRGSTGSSLPALPGSYEKRTLARGPCNLALYIVNTTAFCR